MVKAIAGEKHFHLTLIKKTSKKRMCGSYKWKMQCDCGNVIYRAPFEIRNGSSKSCGCAHLTADNMSTTFEYRAWRHARERCTDPKLHNYHRYGGRGIRVSKRWATFRAFFEDMGKCPTGWSLERIDSDKNYSLGNCIWATTKLQSFNRSRVELANFKQAVEEEFADGNISRSAYAKYMRVIERRSKK